MRSRPYLRRRTSDGLYTEFPVFSILLSLGSGVLTSIMSKRVARLWNTLILVVITVMSAVLFIYMLEMQKPYTFMMGHFPAPWGNEIRAGVLEAGMALFFCMIMLLSLIGGQEHLNQEVEDTKINLYYIYGQFAFEFFACTNLHK